jgi:glyoxylate/hydroxypyruvate reductase
MNILLIGDLTVAAYETWRSHLYALLPRNEHLVVATDNPDKSTVDIALVANPPWGELAKYPNLRFVQSLWAGVDRLLGDPTLPANITLARLIDPTMAQTMIEGTVAATLYLHRQFPTYRRQQDQSVWKQLPQPTANHRTIGLLGYGQMAQPVAHALRSLGFTVRPWGQHERPGVAHGEDGLRSVLAEAQILINLLPLTTNTAGILNARLFSLLPNGAALINFGRGDHLNEEDLIEALDRKHLSHAVLDVFKQEPLPPEHPFWTHPRITVFPHVAATTDPATAAPIAVQNIMAFRKGEPLTGLVARDLGY